MKIVYSDLDEALEDRLIKIHVKICTIRKQNWVNRMKIDDFRDK